MAPYQIGPNISEGSSSAPERCCAPISAAGARISSSLAVLTLHVKPRENFASFFPAVNGWSPSYLEELVEAYYIIKSSFVLGCGGKKRSVQRLLKVLVLICK